MFTTADLNTPYVENAIKLISNGTGESITEIVKQAKDYIKEQISNETGVDGFDKIDRQNYIEGFLFDKLHVESTDRTVSRTELKEMFKWIIAANRALFILIDPITGKRVQITIHLTPTAAFVKQPDWMKDVETAAATASGEIVFNTDFARRLIKYAEVKGIKANGKMYKSNGGNIPDSYAYIEFLILHEIYHIVNADHFYQSITPGMTGKKQNYLGDYIINYNLVKKGYSQLPIGLMSDKYNYDNYGSMKELQRVFLEDSKKLNKEKEEKMDNQMDDHLDKDNKPQNKKGGEPGGEPQNKKGGEPSSDDKEMEKKLEQAAKDNFDDMKDANERNEMTKEEVDEITKNIEDEIKNNNDVPKSRKDITFNSNAKPGDKVFKPIEWKKLIQFMIPKPVVKIEDSLSKMHRRTVAGMASGSDNIAVKAGEVKTDQKSQSMVVLLDVSGSMSKTIMAIEGDLISVINKNKTLGIKNFYIIKFDSEYKTYKINLDPNGRKHTFQRFENDDDISSSPEKAALDSQKHPLNMLFREGWGGATKFPEKVSKLMLLFLKEGYNSVVFTDEDIFNTGNVENIKTILTKARSKPYSFNLIFNSADVYANAKKHFGAYKYMSYVE